MRSGTDNVPGIAGLGCAAKEAYTDFDKKVTHLCELKQFFMEELQKIPDTVLNSLPGDQGAPHIVSAVSYTHLDVYKRQQILITISHYFRLQI